MRLRIRPLADKIRMDLRVRPVSHNDCILLHSWLNNPLERGMGLNPGKVSAETLKGWLYVFTSNKDVLSLVAELLVGDRWMEIAQVCIHTDGEISISVYEEYRGKRLATPVISASLDFAKYNSSINKVFAKIRYDNTPSIRAFKRAGFRFKGETTVNNYPCVEYVYELLRMAG